MGTKALKVLLRPDLAYYPMAYSTPWATALQRAIPATRFAVGLRHGVVLVRRARPALAGPSKVRRTGSALRAWVLCLTLLCGWPARANSEEVVVVVNPATPVGESIARNTLSAIFGMRLRTWEDGTPIRVYVLPDNHALHGMFCKQILGVFPHQYRSAWDRLVYSGTGQAPLEVASEEEMRARVAGTRGEAPVVVVSEEEMRTRVAGTSGAIGYLSRKMIDESVTVLPVR
ncbi:MAG: substrate-binding domain-containing protein [Gammaproteobacteria bacterium]